MKKTNILFPKEDAVKASLQFPEGFACHELKDALGWKLGTTYRNVKTLVADGVFVQLVGRKFIHKDLVGQVSSHKIKGGQTENMIKQYAKKGTVELLIKGGVDQICIVKLGPFESAKEVLLNVSIDDALSVVNSPESKSFYVAVDDGLLTIEIKSKKS